MTTQFTEEDIKKSLVAEIYAAKSHFELAKLVSHLVGNKVELSEWLSLTERRFKQAEQELRLGEKIIEANVSKEELNEMDELIRSKVAREKFANGFVTIGCVGMFRKYSNRKTLKNSHRCYRKR